MRRVGAPLTLLALANLFCSCVKREATPTFEAPLLRVYVRLERIATAHPSQAAFRWQHPLPATETPKTPAAAPVHVRGRELSLNLATRPDEPLTPEWTALRGRAEMKERAAIDATFARARGRETNNARFLEEELNLDAEDKLEKLRAKLEKQLQVAKEEARARTAEEIAQIRLKSLPATVRETPAQAAKRKADDEQRVQDARDRLAAVNARLDAQMGKELTAADQQQREEVDKKVRQARQEQRARSLPEEDAQRRLLRDDFAAPSPMRLKEQAPPSAPAPMTSNTLTAHEPGLTLRVKAPLRDKAGPDSQLIRSWSHNEAKSLIDQWAKLHRYELVAYEKANNAVDRTDECLGWLRAGVWKSSRPPGKS